MMSAWTYLIACGCCLIIIADVVTIGSDQVCPEDRAGENCSLSCTNCKYGRCNPINGSCLDGCRQMYWGDTCNESCFNNGKQGYYGPECNLQCPTYCTFDECDITYGICAYGCNDKIVGDCPNATFFDEGTCPNCKGRCWSNLCFDGCLDGYGGPSSLNCSLSCNDFPYAKGCRLDTTVHCAASADLDFVTGQCAQGCQAGYIPPNCTQECHCSPYGTHCDSERCINGSCRIGYMGDLCNEDCNYGVGCKEYCSFGCKGYECDPRNGTCIGGCRRHKFGIHCDKECHCAGDDVPCDQITGTCPQGCEKGYLGETCSIRCLYGNESCLYQCGHCKDGTQCNSTNGDCPAGCQPGYYSLGDTNCKFVDYTYDDLPGWAIAVIAVSAGVFFCCISYIVIFCFWRFKLRGRLGNGTTSHNVNMNSMPDPKSTRL